MDEVDFEIGYQYTYQDLQSLTKTELSSLSIDIEADIKRLEHFLEIVNERIDSISTMNPAQTSILVCPHCNDTFGIHDDYEGVVTCPYCGLEVEQP